ITNNWSIEGGTGVFCDNVPATIVNNGWIAGNSDSGIFLRTTTGVDLLNNYGTIFGASSGIRTFTMPIGGGGLQKYNNHGVIESDNIGIHVQGLVDFLVSIFNFQNSIIRGPVAVDTLDSGRINVTNIGLIDGMIRCMAANANDHVINKAVIKGAIFL